MDKHQAVDRSLHNLFRFLYADLHDPYAVIFHENGIVETPTDCFRIGYSPAKRTFFLMHGEHPDELAATAEMDNGCLEFAHKERLHLIKGYQALPDDWIKNGRNKLDLSWVVGDVGLVQASLPRIFFQEACLHQLTETSSASALIGYRVHMPATAGQQAMVEMTTKSSTNHLFAEVPDRVFGTQKKPLGRPRLPSRLFRGAAHLIGGRHPPVYLSLLQHKDGKSAEAIRTFDPENLGALILTDACAQRLKLIEDGFDPLSLKEQPFLWVGRASESLRRSLGEFGHGLKTEPMKTVRETGLHAALFAVDGPHAALAEYVLGAVFHLGEREETKILSRESRPEWKQLIASHRHRSPRSIRIKSELHDNVARPDPAQFGDIGALNPAKHDILQDVARGRTVRPDEGRSFQLWLRRAFLEPRAGTFRYFDREGALVDPRHLTPQEIEDRIALVRFKKDNGVHLYFNPRTRDLYAYYHKPERRSDLDLPEGYDDLPAASATYFRINRVLKMNLSLRYETRGRMDPPSMQLMSFEEFKAELEHLMRGVHTPVPERPSEDVIGYRKIVKKPSADRALDMTMIISP